MILASIFEKRPLGFGYSGSLVQIRVIDYGVDINLTVTGRYYVCVEIMS